jgi:hypothetical protein
MHPLAPASAGDLDRLITRVACVLSLTLALPCLWRKTEVPVRDHCRTGTCRRRSEMSGCVVWWLYLPRRCAVHGDRPVSTLNSTWPRNMPQAVSVLDRHRPVVVWSERPTRHPGAEGAPAIVGLDLQIASND